MVSVLALFKPCATERLKSTLNKAIFLVFVSNETNKELYSKGKWRCQSFMVFAVRVTLKHHQIKQIPFHHPA
jgi:predicted nucleotide-binding protein (sugar kinase/HSP70/actin superfamily)